ncbi:MAG: 6-phosphogluconolactonase [Gemmatimonadota bacterium]
MASVRVYPSADELARAVADFVVLRAADAIAGSGRFTMALSGGSTPRALYSLLATPEYADRISWTHAHLFWSDERCVPPDDPSSNYRMARETLIDRVPIPAEQVHRIRGEDDPSAAAEAYDLVLRTVLGSPGPDHSPVTGFDLVLLGLGEDGHTASLFPGKSGVREKTRWVVAEDVEAVGMWRITLTPVVINAAHSVAFMVSGAGKSARLKEVLEEPANPDRLPAQAIKSRSGGPVWMVDQAATGA